jgi:dihydroflavonol-4-reductase
MKIFITGATGFIGNQVLNRLCQKKEHELVCLVRKLNDASDCLQNLGANLIMGDVTDKDSVSKAMKGCTHVIHLAGLYSFWEKDFHLYEKVNVEGTRNVMECALELKISKVVHVSSVVTFGFPPDSPINEESEHGPCFSRYAETKRVGDQIVWDLHKTRGLPVVVIHPGGVLGAGDPKTSGSYIADLVHKRMPATIFNKSTLAWVYVGDVAEAIIRALEKPDNIGEKYIIAKYNLKFEEFNYLINEISGVSLPYLSMPDSLAMVGSYFLTGISNIFKFKPPYGMSWDQMRTMHKGFIVDGSKAERELGINYTPIEKAIEEELSGLKH